MKTVLVAGASGFIGKALIEDLLKDENIQIVALSRKERPSDHPRITWRKCDLFSFKDVNETMVGCDAAYYLVHSMLPSAALSQGTFYDFDLIMADNFVRGANAQGVSEIIYLGGLIPQTKRLSWHLRSRLEVEQTLRLATAKVTTLRAGLIIGTSGSSFFILQKLVERLPFMLFPSWTNSRSAPIALPDVIRILVRSLNDKTVQGKTYDIGGNEALSYQDLIKRTAELMGRKLHTANLDFIPLYFSRFWVSLISGAPKSLVYPLVLSLRHSMIVDPKNAWPYSEDIKVSLDDALKAALQVSPERAPITFQPAEKEVRSIQRLHLPKGCTAEDVAAEYFAWLPRFLSPLIQVKREGNCLSFYILHLPWVALVLKKNEERSSPDRQLLYINGGFLAAAQDRGRLEFRAVLDHKYVMAGIHNFRPALPWFIYRFSQAIVHLWVMKAFGHHLESKDEL